MSVKVCVIHERGKRKYSKKISPDITDIFVQMYSTCQALDQPSYHIDGYNFGIIAKMEV